MTRVGCVENRIGGEVQSVAEQVGNADRERVRFIETIVANGPLVDPATMPSLSSGKWTPADRML